MVVALGGNALLHRGDPLDVATQRRHLGEAASVLSALAREHTLLITHGNGPQVGLLALRSEALLGLAADPLDVLGAESEGMIGYLIEQQLRGVLPEREVATLLTQVEVDPDDPAFRVPTKPIGPVYGEAEALRLSRERGFSVAQDGGGWRRVVPSPEPLRVLEIRTIQLLLDAGVLVVCAGGGGIPVAVDGAGAIRGMEAVIDKDRSAALLGVSVGAEALLLLTDVTGFHEGWGGDSPRLLRETTPAKLRQLNLGEGAAGSMGPKAEAACRFVERTGCRAAIGALGDALALAHGEVGTQIRPNGARR